MIIESKVAKSGATSVINERAANIGASNESLIASPLLKKKSSYLLELFLIRDHSTFFKMNFVPRNKR